MNIAQQLLAGSTEVDRMRIECDQLISMLRGRVLFVEEESKKTFRDGVCTWEVFTQPIAKFDRRLGHHIRLYVQDKQYPTRRVLAYDSTEPKGERVKMPLDYVQQAYNSLPFFVEWMFEVFAYLSESCKPFLEAANTA